LVGKRKGINHSEDRGTVRKMKLKRILGE